MTTKRLSKTVIEGGRYGRNKSDRYQSNAEVRQEERDFLKAAKIDPDLADEIDIDKRTKVSKDFSDKLSPVKRWLKSKVGEPWAEVRKEVFEKFDTKTTAGRHITFDHLLRDVVDTESGYDRYGRHPLDKDRPAFEPFFVDEKGVLRKNDQKHWPKYVPYPAQEELDRASKFLSNRIITEKGGKFWWCVSTSGIWRVQWEEVKSVYGGAIKRLQYSFLTNGHHETVVRLFGLSEFKTVKHEDYYQPTDKPFSFRKRGELTKKEVKELKSFDERIVGEILAFGKGR